MSAPSVEVEVGHVCLMPGDDLEVTLIALSAEPPFAPLRPIYKVQLAMGADGRPRLFVSDGVEVLDWSDRQKAVCSKCQSVIQNGPAHPISHGLCVICAEAYDLELRNEDGPVSGDGGQAVDPTTPGHEGGDALRPEGNGAEVSA